ncbi:hypothetical protein T261_06537 [Streptomyces lydicus]|nr:hypothetical protein T261_06537 [Streptomyces lydicus]
MGDECGARHRTGRRGHGRARARLSGIRYMRVTGRLAAIGRGSTVLCCSAAGAGHEWWRAGGT